MDLSGVQFFELLFWHWWALGLMLVVAEGMSPYGIFSGMAISALMIGTISIGYPTLAWEAELAIFATGAVIFTVIWRKIFSINRNEDEEFATRDKAKNQIGREFQLIFPLQNGFSEIELDGVNWELKGPDTKAGSWVRVISLDGLILVVAPIRTPKPAPIAEEQPSP